METIIEEELTPENIEQQIDSLQETLVEENEEQTPSEETPPIAEKQGASERDRLQTLYALPPPLQQINSRPVTRATALKSKDCQSNSKERQNNNIEQCQSAIKERQKDNMEESILSERETGSNQPGVNELISQIDTRPAVIGDVIREDEPREAVSPQLADLDGPNRPTMENTSPPIPPVTSARPRRQPIEIRRFPDFDAGGCKFIKFVKTKEESLISGLKTHQKYVESWKSCEESDCEFVKENSGQTNVDLGPFLWLPRSRTPLTGIINIGNKCEISNMGPKKDKRKHEESESGGEDTGSVEPEKDITKPIKKITCTFPGCDFKASKAGNLKRHIKSKHSVDGRNTCYQCPRCQVWFKERKEYLKSHLGSHGIVDKQELKDICKNANEDRFTEEEFSKVSSKGKAQRNRQPASASVASSSDVQPGAEQGTAHDSQGEGAAVLVSSTMPQSSQTADVRRRSGMVNPELTPPAAQKPRKKRKVETPPSEKTPPS